MSTVKSQNYLPQIIDDVSQIISHYAQKRIIWFGYTHSHWVDVLQAALKERGQQLDYIIDNDSTKWGRVSPYGIIVSPPGHVFTANKTNSILLVMSNYAEAILAEAKKCDYPEKQIVVLKSSYDYSAEAEKTFENDVSSLKTMELRELQMCEFEILKALRDFCNDNGLRYYLSGGTCYGAAHYKGFIPWDDDIDVQMPYDDFMKLIKYYPKGGRYEIVFWTENDEFFFPCAQLVDNATAMVYGSLPISMLQSVFIDIFPTTGSPANIDEIKYRRELYCYLDAKWRWFYNSRNVLNAKTDDCRQDIWDKKFDLSFDESEMLAAPFEFRRSGDQWVLPREVFQYGETLEFEGERFSVMKGWKEFLNVRYPHWRPLTAKEQQISAHSIKAFWK